MDRSRVTILGVPIDSVGESGGTGHGPAALRDALVPEGLDDAGDTARQIHGTARDPDNGWLAFEDNLAVAIELRERIAGMVAAGRVPLVLGGCCALVPGVLAGLRDSLGEIGLAYVDGHLDLLTGETSPTGEAADMPVATALGIAPSELLDCLGETPVVDPARIAFAGPRDEEEARLVGTLPEDLGINGIMRRDDLRGADLGAVGSRLAEIASGADDGPFWLHLDVDVLDLAVFPATDYLMDDGLDFGELAAILGPIGSSPRLAGASVACFNPDRDPDGSCGRTLAGLMRQTLIK